MHRRTFLGATASAVALGAAKMPSADAPQAPIPLVHQTDLFRPHGDPDDHFDLAAVNSMLDRELTTHWLKSLRAPVDAAKLAAWGTKPRNMWGTATFQHLAGLTVNADGQLIPADQPGVYVVKPITATCTDDGHTQWREGPGTPARYKFEIVDEAHYAAAMTKALLALIKPLGQDYVATPGK